MSAYLQILAKGFNAPVIIGDNDGGGSPESLQLEVGSARLGARQRLDYASHHVGVSIGMDDPVGD